MTIRHDLDPETRASLRDVDPVQSARDDGGAGLDTEAALRVVLARAEQESGESWPAPRRRLRRGLQLGVVAAAAATAAIVAVNVGSSGGGRIPATLDHSAVGIGTAQAGTLAARVRRALAGVPGGILEVEIAGSGHKTASLPLQHWTIHYWESVGRPGDDVTVNANAGGTPSITGEHDGQLEYYDQAADTVGIMTPTPAVEAAQGTTPRAQALAMLRSRSTTIDRHATFDGRPALKLTSRSQFTVNTMYLAEGSYTPLEYLVAAAPGATADVRGYLMVERYLVYRTLTGAQARPSLVSLTDQHPNARVVHESSAAWNAVESRLDS